MATVGNFQDFRDAVSNPKDGYSSPEHDKLLHHIKNLFDISRKDMSKHYSTWDYNDQIFRSRKVMDKEDRAANAKGQPAKIILPLTFSQVMTFVTFAVMTTTQNTRFFELESTGTQVNPLKEPMELILERDCRKNAWTAFLIQYFLDIGKFSLGAAEICYKEEYRMVRAPKMETQMGAFGISTDVQTNDFLRLPHFVGNKVYPVSPYRFFPDTRLPHTRFQEGEFCGSEDMFSMAGLKSDSDNLFNLDKIRKMTKKEYDERRKSSRIDVMEFLPVRSQGGDASLGEPSKDGFVESGAVVISKMVCDIVPNNFTLGDKGEKPLGDEKFPIRYIVWIANDKTIVRFDEASYLHGQFPYISSQYLPDQHKNINESLADICDQVQNLITWLINSHVTSIRSTMDGGKFIVDPAGVDIKSLESRSPYIFLKKNASQTGIDRYIKQFEVKDITAGYMGDVSQLKDMLENITGQSSIMQGQYSAGRRDATQSKAVIQGGSARGKLLLSGIWDTSFVSLGKQMIANNRQEMDIETFTRIIGVQTDPTKPSTEQLFQLFQADPMTIATAEDFFVFDGTLPSEKSYLAQSLQEILMQIMQSPQIAQILGYGPEQIKFLFNEIYELRGVTPPLLPPANPPAPQPQVPGQPPAPPGQPAFQPTPQPSLQAPAPLPAAA